MFTTDELTIIKMYSGLTPDRDKTVSALRDILSFIEEPVKSTIRKANAMTAETFATLDLSDTLEF